MFRPTVQLRMSSMSNSQSRSSSRSGAGSSSGVSLRPRAGSRYTRSASTTEESNRWWRDFGSVPGGRKLWCRLVVLFTFVCLFGIGFIFLGAAFIHQAYAIYKEKQLSLPLTWCVIGIVSGSLMVLGSIVLGRFIISDKWRKNQQPNYPSMAPRLQPRPAATVRYTTNNNTPESEADVQIDFPPPYDASNLPPIFIVSGRNVAVTLPAPNVNVTMPPSYTDTVGAPPKYTEIDNADQAQGESSRNETTESEDTTSPDRPTTSQLPPNPGCNRIEVITVVSTREDPPPYDPGPTAGPLSLQVTSLSQNQEPAPPYSAMPIDETR